MDRATQNALRNVRDQKPVTGKVSLRTLECRGLVKFEQYVVHAAPEGGASHVSGGWTLTAAGEAELGAS